MTNYYPDSWVVFSIHRKGKTNYKLLGGWVGGYAAGDSWRINSGIESVSENNGVLSFTGVTGSVYHVYKDAYGLRRSTAGIWNQLERNYGDVVALLPETTDWTAMQWNSKE